ncbi:Uncharacterised protein [[Clostridium] sordellii]|uniref:hypothetical protein n=1 Tax=Paraclostridium sordellii TaxID=1505 RepID=UPI0005E3B262|nr:hypothetical protein [Paeniclostridium sordellii]CEP95501.1 Uncharacterised protein [[Clostridium] sordellii] [Paeniclostridium sordellii]
MIKILSVSMIVLGILLMIAQLKEGYDKTYIGKYNKIKFFINLVYGFSFAIMGLLAILKVISEKRFINLLILFGVLRGLIDYKIKDQENR